MLRKLLRNLKGENERSTFMNIHEFSPIDSALFKFLRKFYFFHADGNFVGEKAFRDKLILSSYY